MPPRHSQQKERTFYAGQRVKIDPKRLEAARRAVNRAGIPIGTNFLDARGTIGKDNPMSGIYPVAWDGNELYEAFVLGRLLIPA